MEVDAFELSNEEDESKSSRDKAAVDMDREERGGRANMVDDGLMPRYEEEASSSEARDDEGGT